MRAIAPVAVVLCACLFELLAAPSLPEGVAPAAAVMDGCIAAVLPGRRAYCVPLELLFERYASLLLRALPVDLFQFPPLPQAGKRFFIQVW
ncbi:unnamed protein product [Closterium sp. NIES-64]|nr:unnamed protein product [Closterium sp. NIES-64]CAI5963157.1 unnamed protein product [Closterium sp. NIES-64]